MSDVTKALESNRGAVDEFLGVAQSMEPQWMTPRSEGKWSPAQVVEHVARTYEEGAKLVAGDSSHFPNMPGFLRPIMRGLFYNRILKNKSFPKAKTFKAFDPAEGPSSVAEGRTRLAGALDKFEDAVRKQDSTTIVSGVFGKVPLDSYVHFQELHARHHQQQLRIDG